ncbi:PAS domain S-box protein, partial [bacterium]
VDRDMRIVFSNWHGGYEYVPHEVRSRHPHCFDAYYPGQGEPCKPCHLQEVFRTGKPVIREKHNPGIGDLEVHAFPVFDDGGNIVMAAEYLRDITSRRRAENALRQANHVLEAIINASPLAIVALDQELNLTLWNDAAETMFGWKKDEILFKPYPIIPEDRLEEVMENIRGLNRGEVRRSVETCRKRRDGSLVDVSLSTASLRDQQGGNIGYMAIMADISERKLNQQALRESEANYRAIFDAANDAIFVLDVENGAILDVNRKLCEMYGYTQEEVLLLKIEDLSSGKTPYTQENAVREIRKARGNKSHLFEWMARDSSGRLFWVEVNMKGAVIGGDYRALAVVRDITERKQSLEALRESEERFRQIFEETEDAALILAPRTFAIVEANSAAARLYGYCKKEMKRKSPALFMEPAQYDKFRQIFSTLDMGTHSRSRPFRIDRLGVVDKSGKSIM